MNADRRAARRLRARAQPRPHHPRRQPQPSSCPTQRPSTPTSSEVAWDVDGLGAKVPGFNSNWTVRSGVRARRAIRHDAPRPAARRPVRPHPGAGRARRPTGSSASPRWCPSTPRRCSTTSSARTTATTSGNRRVEKLKWRANRTCFERARHIVAWSEWAKAGVVDGYGIDARQDHRHPAGRRRRRSGIVRPGAPAAGDGPCASCSSVATSNARAATVAVDAFADLRAELASGSSVRACGRAPPRDQAPSVPPTPGVIVHHGP